LRRAERRARRGRVGRGDGHAGRRGRPGRVQLPEFAGRGARARPNRRGDRRRRCLRQIWLQILTQHRGRRSQIIARHGQPIGVAHHPILDVQAFVNAMLILVEVGRLETVYFRRQLLAIGGQIRVDRRQRNIHFFVITIVDVRLLLFIVVWVAIQIVQILILALVVYLIVIVVAIRT